ncbi:dihydroorotase [Salinicoccus kekensis]|uniref:Allantoinase n=1 Tax=Salinicoccus kekensis TaxID=714307 RepID=A0A285UPK0_9STAP|nr:amidohydrolase family protein [Salinicoccus kekensis]SOC43739.1 allantoinase [Salinicoccus kekensis]
MQFDKVFKGTIVLEDEVLEKGYIGIKDGKTVEISVDPLEGDLIDFTGKVILPGAIDVHVHSFSNPEEGFAQTSKLAARGGVTTFVDMPYDLPNPVNNTGILKEKIIDLEKNAYVDIALWGTIAKRNGTGEIQKLMDEGVTSFKMSTFETDAYRFPKVPNDEIIKAMEILAETGIVAAFHSEDDEIVKGLSKQLEEENKTHNLAHAETRPPYTESAAALMLMEFAKWTGAKIHIVHASHPRTIELVKLFKEMGTDVSVETCYTYLLLDEEDLKEQGPPAKMNPPLRPKEDVEGMWEHLKQGNIDMISSDHIVWDIKDKEKGYENIFKSPSGLPGVEVIVPLMFDAIVSKRNMPLNTFAKLMATNAAERFSIKNKGKIAKGHDADFIIIDPDEEWTFVQENFETNIDLLPFKDRQFKGRIKETIIRGETVYDGRDMVVDPGYGHFIEGPEKK